MSAPRPSLPSPAAPSAYTVAELAAAAGIKPRAVRYYISFGLLPAPPFRGVATVYGREHLVRLRAIAHLRRTEHLRLHVIRQRLDRMTPEDLERFAAPDDGPPAASTTATASGSGSGSGPWRPTAARPRESWTRILLCPGVELHVRTDADTESDRVAREIVARYAVP